MGMPLLVSVRAPAPRRPSMPVEVLDSVDGTAHLDPTELGSLLALCRAFWAGGCRPLPINDVDLMRLSGCDLRRWRLVREPVLEAFEQLKPVVSSVYAQSLNTSLGRAAGAEATNAKRRANRPKVALVDNTVPGPLTPAKDFSSVKINHTNDGVAIPARVIRSNSAARLTDRS